MTGPGPSGRRPGLPGALRRLATDPPPGFGEGVLDRLGLGEEVDEYGPVEALAGPVFVAFNRRGVCHVAPAALVDGDAARFEEEHRRRFGRPARPAARLPDALAGAVRTGEPGRLAFDLRGLSGFERAVLRAACGIPRGELRPYAWVAREVGRPRAVRAVGSALGHNPVPVLIPCHRVVRSDGRLGEYVFGPALKRALLSAEAVDVEGVERLARAGTRLVADPATGVFCYPTCHRAPRPGRPARAAFASAARAEAAGYRPCPACRPVGRDAVPPRP